MQILNIGYAKSEHHIYNNTDINNTDVIDTDVSLSENQFKKADFQKSDRRTDRQNNNRKINFSALSKILCKSKTKQAKGRLARASIIWDFLLLQYSRRVKRYARRRRECRFTLREKY